MTRLSSSTAALILVVFIIHVLTDEKVEELKRAHAIMQELLAGEADPWRYVAGFFTIIVFVAFCIGFLIWFVGIICNCCMCTKRCTFWTFRGVRKFFSWLCCCGGGGDGSRRSAKKRCLSTYQPFIDGDFEQSREPCVKTLESLVNGRGSVVVVPYCASHFTALAARVFKRAGAFEAEFSRYPINFYFGETPKNLDYSNIVAERVESAKHRARGRPGFIYVFNSIDDLTAVSAVSVSQDYFYKIGMTRRKTAKERVDEWPGAVFKNTKNYDWWETSDASVAEDLIHAVLARERIARYNRLTNDFEIEWFFTTRVKVMMTVKKVIDVVRERNFDELLQNV